MELKYAYETEHLFSTCGNLPGSSPHSSRLKPHQSARLGCQRLLLLYPGKPWAVAAEYCTCTSFGPRNGGRFCGIRHKWTPKQQGMGECRVMKRGTVNASKSLFLNIDLETF
ncbi:unnamed protein product [Arctia plantaginis]|uniref:Uncharacterized protein n=1 Tax=Arctia plantaginis TaxID=874455 RepID=A0A8S0Z428_ARCPL|nr:unnamed protein product [Arctia plantaginis]